MKYLPILALAVVAPFAANASNSFDAYPDPKLRVNAVGGGQFEVVERRGAGALDVWCAAARYTIRENGSREGRLYVAGVRGPSQTTPGSKGVIFTTSPTADANSASTLSIRDSGRTMSVSRAERLCDIYISGRP